MKRRKKGNKIIMASDNDRSECMRVGSYAIRVVRPCGTIETDEAHDRLNDAITRARRIIQSSDVKRLEIKTAFGTCHYRYDAIDVRPVFKTARDIN